MAVIYTERPVTTVAEALRVPLTTTSATTVLQFTPRTDVQLMVRAYVAAKSASALTLALTWTDPDLGSMEYDFYPPGSSVPAGAAAQVAYPLVAQGGTPVTLTATAGMANAVTISAKVER